MQSETSVAHLCVYFLVERSLLQLQFSFGVSHLGVSLELNVYHLLLTFCFLGDEKGAKYRSAGCGAQQKTLLSLHAYPYPSIPLCLRHADVCIPLHSGSLGLPKRAQVIQFIINILRAETKEFNTSECS